MTVIEWNPDTVQTEGGKKGRIAFRKEIFQKLVEEIFIIFLTKAMQHSSTVLMFTPWHPCNKIFHVHPSSQSGSSEKYLHTCLIHYFIARDFEKGRHDSSDFNSFEL
jgi:hypothetical protein